MTDATREVRPLSTYATGSSATGWWGIAMLILIESTVFAGLIATYFYLFANATVWPPDGISQPKLGLPIIYSIVLLASLVPAIMADLRLRNGNLAQMRLLRAVATLMLAIFLVLKAYEYINLDYRWDDGAYGSSVWVIAGFHTGHVITVMLKTFVTQTLAWKGFFNAERRSAVEGTTLYWAFVVLMWIPLFVTLYLFPHLNG
jgi:heme/copper-type cytochrome/quinol oxidase subunit 3